MTDLEYLEGNCTPIDAVNFYRLIFPTGELEKKGEYLQGQYTGIAVCVGNDRKIRRYTITDDLEVINDLVQTDDFCIMSPISYAGKSRKSENARFLYALAIDLDGLKQEQVKGVPIGIDTLFWQFEGHGKSDYLPVPTAIVSSGTGLHLYYVFRQPIPLFKNIVDQLQILKKRLTWMLWTQGVSDLQNEVQYETLFQGFRMPDTITKAGRRARAFLIDGGKKVDIAYLNKFVPDEYKAKDFVYKSKLTKKEAAEKYREWYYRRIELGQPRGTWVANRAVYDWWLRQIQEKAEDGHRYYCVMALATYAKKCGISAQELEQDAMGMIEMLDGRGKRADNPFTVDDVLAALDAYDDSYITYPIDAISARSGIPIQKNKRNYRKQAVHLARARAVQAIDYPDYEWAGRPSEEEKVKQWQRQHPDGRKADCIRETGLSKPTVYKWWGR